MKLRSGRKTKNLHLDANMDTTPTTPRRSPRMHSTPAVGVSTSMPNINHRNRPRSTPNGGIGSPIPDEEDEVVLVAETLASGTYTPRRSPRNGIIASSATMPVDDEVVIVNDTPPRRSPRHALASGVSKPSPRRSGRIQSARGNANNATRTPTRIATRRRGRNRVSSPAAASGRNASRVRRRRATGTQTSPPNENRRITRLAGRSEPLRLPISASAIDIEIDIDELSPVGSTDTGTNTNTPISSRGASSSSVSSSPSLIAFRHWSAMESPASSAATLPSNSPTPPPPPTTRVLRTKVSKKSADMKKQVPATFTCGVCFDDFPTKDAVILCGLCPERFCSGCMGQFLKLATENRQYPLKCPGCMSAMDAWKCVSALHNSEQDTATALTTLILEREHVGTLKYCSNKHCSTPFDFDGNPTGSGARVECPLCDTATCVRCGSEWHEGRSCAEVAAGAPLALLAETLNWKHCPTCNELVERIDGCVHIVCRCGTEFCYSCGNKYVRGMPTCTCVHDEDSDSEDDEDSDEDSEESPGDPDEDEDDEDDGNLEAMHIAMDSDSGFFVLSDSDIELNTNMGNGNGGNENENNEDEMEIVNHNLVQIVVHIADSSSDEEDFGMD